MQETGSVRQNIWDFVLFFEDYALCENLIFLPIASLSTSVSSYNMQFRSSLLHLDFFLFLDSFV